MWRPFDGECVVCTPREHIARPLALELGRVGQWVTFGRQQDSHGFASSSVGDFRASRTIPYASAEEPVTSSSQ